MLVPVRPSLAELELGFVRRLTGHAPFAALVPLRYGWPAALVEKPVQQELPLVTYIVTSPVRLDREPERLEIQTDIWTWRSDAAGGRAQLLEIDGLMLELLGAESAVSWAYDREEGDDTMRTWISSVCVESSDPVEVRMHRRRRIWEMAGA